MIVVFPDHIHLQFLIVQNSGHTCRISVLELCKQVNIKACNTTNQLGAVEVTMNT